MVIEMSAKVYPVKLATCVQVDFSHNVLNTRFGEKIDTAILSYIILDGDQIIVFDTGHKILNFSNGLDLNLDGNAAENFAKKFAELNLSFEDVTHVVLSHLHWDHVQNCDLFPNANIYIQRSEMAFAAAPIYPLYYETQDIANLLGNFSDKIVFVDGDEQLTDHVKLVLLGGHSPGSQAAYIQTSQGTVILTGDVLNVYENLDVRSVKEIDVIGWVKAIKRIKAEGDIILPQHEPRVVTDYPSIE